MDREDREVGSELLVEGLERGLDRGRLELDCDGGAEGTLLEVGEVVDWMPEDDLRFELKKRDIARGGATGRVTQAVETL